MRAAPPPPSRSMGLGPTVALWPPRSEVSGLAPGSKNSLREGELGEFASGFTGRPQQP